METSYEFQQKNVCKTAKWKLKAAFRLAWRLNNYKQNLIAAHRKMSKGKEAKRHKKSRTERTLWDDVPWLPRHCECQTAGENAGDQPKADLYKEEISAIKIGRSYQIPKVNVINYVVETQSKRKRKEKEHWIYQTNFSYILSWRNIWINSYECGSFDFVKGDDNFGHYKNYFHTSGY